MNKMNKKGFTLIEMLVVIAIIAVLVSIIVPTVSSATTKAKAATDAANLRSAKAVATIMALEDSTLTSLSAAQCGVPETGKMGGTFSCMITTSTGGVSTVEVKYGENTIESLALIAEKGTSAAAGGSGNQDSGNQDSGNQDSGSDSQ